MARKSKKLPPHFLLVFIITVIILLGGAAYVIQLKTAEKALVGEAARQVKTFQKPTTFIACPWSFTPSGNSLQIPTGFKLSELFLAGVVCSNAEVRCAYSSEKLGFNDMFATSTLNSIETKALVGSMSLTAVAPANEKWSNCQNAVQKEFGCTCEVSS